MIEVKITQLLKRLAAWVEGMAEIILDARAEKSSSKLSRGITAAERMEEAALETIGYAKDLKTQAQVTHTKRVSQIETARRALKG